MPLPGKKLPRILVGKSSVKDPDTFAERLEKKVKNWRRHPWRTGFRAALALVILGLACQAWGYRSSETWIVAPETVRLSVGATATVSATLHRKPPFLWRDAARAIPARIELIGTGDGIEVTPGCVVTTAAQPAATFTLTGKRLGRQELVYSASQSPTVPSTWRTASLRAVVVK